MLNLDIEKIQANIDEQIQAQKTKMLEQALNDKYSQELNRILKDKKVKSMKDVLQVVGEASNDTVSKNFINWLMDQPFETFLPSMKKAPSQSQLNPNEPATPTNFVSVTHEQVLNLINTSNTPIGVSDIVKLFSQTLGNVNPDQVKEHTAFLRESKQVATEGLKRGMKYKPLPQE